MQVYVAEMGGSSTWALVVLLVVGFAVYEVAPVTEGCGRSDRHRQLALPARSPRRPGLVAAGDHSGWRRREEKTASGERMRKDATEQLTKECGAH